jgi:UDP-glucose 4-epimerase
LFIRIQVLVRACGVDRGRGSTTTTALEIMTELPSVEDVHAVFHALTRFVDGKEAFDVYNVGSLDRVDVRRIAEIVGEEMGLEGLGFRFTGGVDGGRGWRGDVKTMLLSVDKLLSLGWKPKLNSEEAVRLSCRELLGL